jgi:tRNA (mo5U34)-methyltransferase
MDAETLRDRVSAVNWFQKMELPYGIITNGEVEPNRTLRRLRLPESFAGREVLDIGAWDGFYSFEAKRRGAARVLATDSFAWSGEGDWTTQAGFLLAREALSLDVEAQFIDVMELSPESVGMFDDVLFIGVLYHLRDPITALERVASVTRDRLFFETETSLSWLPSPATAIYYPSRLKAPRGAVDTSNCYAPNPAALRSMLRAVGFGDIRIVYRQSLPWRVARSAVLGLRGNAGWLNRFRSQRILIHARKES